MKVGDTVKRANATARDAAARYVLIEHHGDEGSIRPLGGPANAAVERVPLSALALAENAPSVVEPSDD